MTMSSGPQQTSFSTRNVADYANVGNGGTFLAIQGNNNLQLESYSPLEKPQSGLIVLGSQSLSVLNQPQLSNLAINNFHNISEPQIISELNNNHNPSNLCNDINNSTQSLVLDQRSNIDTGNHRQRNSLSSLSDLRGSLTSATSVIPRSDYLNGQSSCGGETLRLRGSSEETPQDTGTVRVGNEYNLDGYGIKKEINNKDIDVGQQQEKVQKPDAMPAWSELKTKAGKERKRLPLACVACRRKKIRCSGEKPACKHCLRSRIPCIYKVTTRKATPKKDYMGILDKRIKRMEERIFKIIPREANDITGNPMPRATVKPKTSKVSARSIAGKKRLAEEAFGKELETWSKYTPELGSNEKTDNTQMFSRHKSEELKLLSEGADELPSKEIQQHLAEVFFENIQGQVYHLFHKPSFMNKLRSSNIPPVLVLAVCAVSARFSTHPQINTIPKFLRGEKWAAKSRSIVMQRYEWPEVNIVICLLILSLHESGTCQGGRSWLFSGMAIRMAFALKLHQDHEYDPMFADGKQKLSFIDRETRKRIMWTCFIMDRINSSGRTRPLFINEDIISLQLPIKERNFLLSIPGSTEYLNGQFLHNDSYEKEVMSNSESNMGVEAYLIRAIALWSRINHYFNITNGCQSHHYLGSDKESFLKNLTDQTDSFHAKLPETLKYTPENFCYHNTEGVGNQFLILHICSQFNVLYLNRFALPGQSRSRPLSGIMKESVSAAVAKCFEAADRISEFLRDGESHFITAPLIGYCAFIASTVQIFGVFSKNMSREAKSKTNLATNVKFLSKIKNYWGIFNWMTENLKEQYKICADILRRGNDLDEPPIVFIEYSDWFDRYPHGIYSSELNEKSVKVKEEFNEEVAYDENIGGHTVEKKELSYATKPNLNLGCQAPKRKVRKPPPAPLITNPTGNRPVQATLNPQCAPQTYNQISPITPVNVYHQQAFYNPSYLFPEYQQPNFPELNRQLALDPFCYIDQGPSASNIIENTSWEIQMNDRNNIDSNMINYSNGSVSSWMLPYNTDPTDFSCEQNIFNSENGMGIGMSKWQENNDT